MSPEVFRHRGREVSIPDAVDGRVTIDGEEHAVLETDQGFRIGFEPPQPTLRAAIERFAETQRVAGVAYRKSFVDLTPDERRRLSDGFQKLFSDGMIQANADLHNDNFYKGIHWGAAFLPWHRDFLRKLELALQAVDSAIMLPFWDWTRLESRDLDQGPWESFFGGRDNVGGMFDSWPYTRNASGAGRQLPVLERGTGAASVMDELSAQSFQEFRRLETGSHVPGHTWTGGTMATGASPLDPLFYLHHCNLDRLWAIWQINNPTADQYTLDPIASDSVPEAAVPLNDSMIGGATPASMLDHVSLGYRYARDRRLERAWADEGLGTIATTV